MLCLHRVGSESAACRRAGRLAALRADHGLEANCTGHRDIQEKSELTNSHKATNWTRDLPLQDDNNSQWNRFASAD
jgi:hypothetical protein